MQRSILLVIAALAWQAAAIRAAEPIDLTVLTFNILVEIGDHPPAPRWKERREASANLILDTKADLIGLQEPTPAQAAYLVKALPGYEALFHKGYPDAMLLYQRDTFEELARGEWWLSPTPDRVSIGFGNALPRLVVWAKLRHKASGRELYFFNTHFDNSMPSQVRMAELCQQKFAPFVAEGLPMLFVGDFNTEQERGDYPKLTSGGWKDSYTVCEKASPGGRDDNVRTMLEGAGRIDHIFYHGDGWKPLKWRRLEYPDPNKPLSDHYPVLAEFRLE